MILYCSETVGYIDKMEKPDIPDLVRQLESLVYTNDRTKSADIHFKHNCMRLSGWELNP